MLDDHRHLLLFSARVSPRPGSGVASVAQPFGAVGARVALIAEIAVGLCESVSCAAVRAWEIARVALAGPAQCAASAWVAKHAAVVVGAHGALPCRGGVHSVQQNGGE